MLRFTTLALILATASTARADDASAYARELAAYQNTTAEILRNPTAGNDGDNPEDCYELLLAAKAAGIEPTTVLLHDKGKKYTLAEVGDVVCKPHKRAHQVAEVIKAIHHGYEMNVWLTQIEMSQNRPENQAMLEKTAKDCAAAADRAAQLGFGDIEFRKGIFLDEAKEKVCEPLAKAAKSFAADVQKAAEAALEAAKAPFKKVGIKGDKLHICASYADRTFRGKGGVELSPAQIKKSNLLFFWSGPDSSSGLYYLQRYAFKGDKLVRQSEVKLIRPPVAKDFR